MSLLVGSKSYLWKEEEAGDISSPCYAGFSKETEDFRRRLRSYGGRVSPQSFIVRVVIPNRAGACPARCQLLPDISFRLQADIQWTLFGSIMVANEGGIVAVNVLVADDSEIVRRRVVDMIAALPFVKLTAEASNASEILRAVEASRFDVVVLDISMPGNRGMEVLQQVKATDLSTVVIMLTNYPYEEYRRQCQVPGADYFFDKAKDFQKIPEVLLDLNAGKS